MVKLDTHSEICLDYDDKGELQVFVAFDPNMNRCAFDLMKQTAQLKASNKKDLDNSINRIIGHGPTSVWELSEADKVRQASFKKDLEDLHNRLCDIKPASPGLDYSGILRISHITGNDSWRVLFNLEKYTDYADFEALKIMVDRALRERIRSGVL